MAIVALIVTPLVMTIIRKAKDSAAKRSVDAYGRSIDSAIASYILDNAEFPESLDELTIEYSGKKVTCGVMALNEDAGVYLSECSVGNYKVKDSSTNDGWYHYEAKNMTSFDYKVGDTVTYKNIEFQVIKNSKSGDDTVTLIKSAPLTSAEITALGDYSASLSSVDGVVALTGENEYSEAYSTSVVKSIIDAWATSNSVLVNINDKARPITNDELVNSLKYNVTRSANVGYVSGYETGSVDWDAKPYWVYSDNTVTKYEFTSSTPGSESGTGAYIRPVVEIQKSSDIVKN